MAKFKIEVVVPDGETCQYEEHSYMCDFLIDDVCNEILECCLFGQRIDRKTKSKCPKCIEALKEVKPNGKV